MLYRFISGIEFSFIADRIPVGVCYIRHSHIYSSIPWRNSQSGDAQAIIMSRTSLGMRWNRNQKQYCCCNINKCDYKSWGSQPTKKLCGSENPIVSQRLFAFQGVFERLKWILRNIRKCALCILHINGENTKICVHERLCVSSWNNAVRGHKGPLTGANS